MTRPQRCMVDGCGRMGSWQVWIREQDRHVWMCDQHHAEAPDAISHRVPGDAPKPSNRAVPGASPAKPRRGVMNATERAWADQLDADPLVKSFRFEEVTFTVGGGEYGKRPKRYTPDFLVVHVEGHTTKFYAVEVHEVKGRHRHRRRGIETLKAAAKQYPEFRWFLVEKAEDGSWRKVPIE